MKQGNVFGIAMLGLLLIAGGCKKADVSANVSPAEVADMVSSSVSVNSNGVANISTDVVTNAQATFDLNIGCGKTKTYSLSRQSQQGATTTYSYSFDYSYTLNCNSNNQPDNITGSSTDKGTFDSPRLSSTNTGSSTFRVAGLTHTATSYVINGEYKRSGTFTSKVDNKTSSTSTVDITLTNVVINKVTGIITSGTATVTVGGTTTKKGIINASGTLTFSGSNKATLSLNGVNYTIDLTTGIVTKA